ncbi:tyrosine-type recombinase/integrase [Caballeronia sp. S22]|uniref:tyrosine-type recombinase/integrase n=1 Tax=Caballeronia sp. S22 TaxID=3137182 RepID=UPI0035313282
MFLEYGSDALRKKLEIDVLKHPEFNWLLNVTRTIYQKPLQPNSFNNIYPALRSLIDHIEVGVEESRVIFDLAAVSPRYASIADATNPIFSLGPQQPAKLSPEDAKAHSVLGQVMRKARHPKRKRNIGSRNKETQSDVKNLPFPKTLLASVVQQATNPRDAFLWLLLAAAGLRPHEGLNTLWEDFDFETGRFYVLDPKKRRLGRDMTNQERLRFKGREVSVTFLIPDLIMPLYRAMQEYHSTCFVPYVDSNAPNFIFQYVERARRGEPYLHVSAKALNDQFKAAVKRAGVSPPRGGTRSAWTIYSLRHMYGDFLLNDIEIDSETGEKGLPLADVQTAMGHAKITSTRVYARTRRDKVEQRLEAADQLIFPQRLDQIPGEKL